MAGPGAASGDCHPGSTATARTNALEVPLLRPPSMIQRTKNNRPREPAMNRTLGLEMDGKRINVLSMSRQQGLIKPGLQDRRRPTRRTRSIFQLPLRADPRPEVAVRTARPILLIHSTRLSRPKHRCCQNGVLRLSKTTVICQYTTPHPAEDQRGTLIHHAPVPPLECILLRPLSTYPRDSLS